MRMYLVFLYWRLTHTVFSRNLWQFFMELLDAHEQISPLIIIIILAYENKLAYFIVQKRSS